MTLMIQYYYYIFESVRCIGHFHFASFICSVLLKTSDL